MTNEEAKRKVRGYLTDILPSDCSDEIDEIMKALEQEPSEDYISIESVIEWLKNKDIIKLKKQEENARRELVTLSSASLQQKINIETAKTCKTCFCEDYNKNLYPCCECNRNHNRGYNKWSAKVE